MIYGVKILGQVKCHDNDVWCQNLDNIVRS